MKNEVRIIGGQWRSRRLAFPDAPGLRPTSDRIRETLFNWLRYDIEGSNCLDLFAGSGALGFEAASRGASAVVQVESNPAICRLLRNNGELLQANGVRLVEQDALRFLNTPIDVIFDIVFLDPPFGSALLGDVCRLLETRGWLKPKAKIYIEMKKTGRTEGLPVNWRPLADKTAGAVAYQLWARES